MHMNFSSNDTNLLTTETEIFLSLKGSDKNLTAHNGNISTLNPTELKFTLVIVHFIC